MKIRLLIIVLATNILSLCNCAPDNDSPVSRMQAPQRTPSVRMWVRFYQLQAEARRLDSHSGDCFYQIMQKMRALYRAAQEEMMRCHDVPNEHNTHECVVLEYLMTMIDQFLNSHESVHMLHPISALPMPRAPVTDSGLIHHSFSSADSK